MKIYHFEIDTVNIMNSSQPMCPLPGSESREFTYILHVGRKHYGLPDLMI